MAWLVQPVFKCIKNTSNPQNHTGKYNFERLRVYEVRIYHKIYENK